MSTQLEDRLRQELRAMAATDPGGGFDAAAVLSRGRSERRRRHRRRWVAGVGAVVTLVAAATVVRPALEHAAPTPPAGPSVVRDATPMTDAYGRLEAVLAAHGIAASRAYAYSPDGRTGFANFVLSRNGNTAFLQLGLHRDLGAPGGFLDACTRRPDLCGPPRVVLGPNVVASPAWYQTITDLPGEDETLLNRRVLERVYRSGTTVEIGVSPQPSDRTPRRPVLDDTLLTRLADAVGDPFPSQD